MSQAGRFFISGGTPITTITGNAGGPVPPNGAGNLDLLGVGDVIVVGNPGINTLFISLSGAIANEYVSDAGTAIPVGNILNVLGGDNINTTGAGNTLKIFLNNTIHWPNTNAGGTTGAIYLGAAGGIGGTLFMHNFGTANTFLGDNSGNLTLTVANATNNTGIGQAALFDLTSGFLNTAVGSGALSSDTTGDHNTAIGSSALLALTSGINNTVLGSGAGDLLINGNNNIFIGHNTATMYTTNESSNIIIGNAGVVTEDNTLRIGTTGVGNAQQNRCFIAGINGVNVGSVASVVSISGDQLGLTTITAGVGVTVTPGANTITIASNGTTTLTYTPVNTTPYVVLATDEFISVDCSGAPITIQLPNAPSTGRVFIIKDRTGNANVNNITVTTVGGAVNIDGAATYTMNTQFAAINVIFSGTAYEIY